MYWPRLALRLFWGSDCGMLMNGGLSDVNQLNGTVSASQLEGWEFDP